MIDETLSSPIAWALQQSNTNSAGIQAQAEAVLAQHAEAASTYLQELDAPDPYPFESLPPGTQNRDLINGGQLFTFADGSSLVVTPETTFRYVGSDGTCMEPTIELGRVGLPEGRWLKLLPGLDPTTLSFEQLGITGLPAGVHPQELSEDRHVFDLPNGARLILDQNLKLVTTMTPQGTLVFLGPHRWEAVGEELETRILSGGGKSFATNEVKGMMQQDGTLHMVIGDVDLVVQLPLPEDTESPNTIPHLKGCWDV